MASQPTEYTQRSPEMSANTNDKQQDKMAQRFTPVNSYLWTPPEHNADSFSQDAAEELPQEWQQTTKLPPLQAHTPPTSPVHRSLPSITAATGYASNDEPLYPERRADRARSQTPLFDAGRSPSLQPATIISSVEDVAQGMLSKLLLGPSANNNHTKYPSSECFPANLGIMTGRQAIEYYHSRVGELEAMQSAMRSARLPAPKKTSSPERDEYTKLQLNRISGQGRVTKSRSQPKPTLKARATSASAATPPAQRTPKQRTRTPKARTNSEFLDHAFPAQDKKQHKRAAASKKIEDGNKHWTDIEDFAPPTSTLDTNGKALKAYWEPKNPLDLSNDPDRNALHPQELLVAATLRLSCAQYMANKRKIFVAKLQTLKEGKGFTKTAAQGACAIDVNKASQLHMAFERVGWLEREWFEKWL